jgi:hypothetical protein
MSSTRMAAYIDQHDRRGIQATLAHLVASRVVSSAGVAGVVSGRHGVWSLRATDPMVTRIVATKLAKTTVQAVMVAWSRSRRCR